MLLFIRCKDGERCTDYIHGCDCPYYHGSPGDFVVIYSHQSKEADDSCPNSMCCEGSHQRKNCRRRYHEGDSDFVPGKQIECRAGERCVEHPNNRCWYYHSSVDKRNPMRSSRKRDRSPSPCPPSSTRRRGLPSGKGDSGTNDRHRDDGYLPPKIFLMAQARNSCHSINCGGDRRRLHRVSPPLIIVIMHVSHHG